MGVEKSYTEEECHKRFAVNLFNLVWEFLDKPKRTTEEDDRMVHAAHASRYHWGEIGGPVEIVRGEWQISRVYSILKRPQPALYHAKRSLDVCQKNDIGDFDLAFAYEAMARALALSGERFDCEKYLQLAKEAGKKIKEEEDRNYFLGELNTIPTSK